MCALSLPITTPSLRIRSIVLEDAERMMALNGEPSTRRWLPSHVYADTGEATSRMRHLISCYATPGDPRLGPYLLAVEHTATGALLGHVGFSPLESDVEVSYAIAEASRGRGYGSEALLHACRWASETFDLPCILAITESENVPSRRTLDRAAFVHVEDVVMEFQGSQQTVSRYVWHRLGREDTPMNKVTPFLMFNDQLEAAIAFYTATFPNSEVRRVARTGEDGPVSSAEFVVGGQHFMGYNGGAYFSFSEGISLYVDCADQKEVDEYWDKFVKAGAQPTQCGWIKDPFGLSWQIVPRRFTELIGDRDPRKVKAVMEAMMTMVKLDVAELERAYDEA